MASVKKMNITIAEWLYGKGHIFTSSSWETEDGKIIGKMDFHDNYDALMEAMQKAMGAGIEFNNSDAYKRTLWYAIYPELKVVKSSEFIYTVDTYICAFTEIGKGRLGYGEKLNQEFKKASPILAMHYSLYRLIKNGLEY
jgi:hypothetical protein